MIILTKFNEQGRLELQYSVKSDNFDLQLTNDYLIPLTSKAYDCKKAGWTSYELEHWDEFGDESFKVFSVGLTPVRKHLEPRVGIFIVPEIEAETTQNGIYIVKGDATEPRADGAKIIAQVVNTSGSTGFGFGKAMAKKYPESKKSLDRWKEAKDNFILGESQLTQLDYNTFVFQMLAQKGIFAKDGEIPLKYSSLLKCLAELKECAINLNASVHMPMIGAGQAKGDWEIIKGMIFQELVKQGIDVTVYTLPAKPIIKNQRNILTLFDEN